MDGGWVGQRPGEGDKMSQKNVRNNQHRWGGGTDNGQLGVTRAAGRDPASVSLEVRGLAAGVSSGMFRHSKNRHLVWCTPALSLTKVLQSGMFRHSKNHTWCGVLSPYL
ncbi:hypothetical protein J6590_020242 [Homalodisca vitripennis]|nr:hypothetical protein J6590_020242 [Homalodisca vitripennis]